MPEIPSTFPRVSRGNSIGVSSLLLYATNSVILDGFHFVDFHCHLDLYPDLATAIHLCETSRTATLAVTTTPKAFRQNMKLAKGAEFVRVALGLHPQLAEERQSELALFEALLPETRYVGEVGLDGGPRFYKSMPAQTAVFRKVLSLCAGAETKSSQSIASARQARSWTMSRSCCPGSGARSYFTGSAAHPPRLAGHLRLGASSQ